MSRIKWSKHHGPNSRGVMSKPVILDIGKPVKIKKKKVKMEVIKKMKGNAGVKDFVKRKKF